MALDKEHLGQVEHIKHGGFVALPPQPIGPVETEFY